MRKVEKVLAADQKGNGGAGHCFRITPNRTERGASTRSYTEELCPTVEKSAQEVSKHVTQAAESLIRKLLMLRHAPGRARTCNPMIRSHILYPIELRVLRSGES
jgi:hypothetical protein